MSHSEGKDWFQADDIKDFELRNGEGEATELEETKNIRKGYGHVHNNDQDN